MRAASLNLMVIQTSLKIGEGGMAIMYRGIQDSLQRPVAIKLLLSDLMAT
jgi:hypothetical protein|tara:strand:- start:1598 stop:1747 length:150 start_codon:yes stop_codon:yes gene_type:complete